MKTEVRSKIIYWLNALEEDCTKARQALLCLRSPEKQLRKLVVPFKDSTKNLVHFIEGGI